MFRLTNQPSIKVKSASDLTIVYKSTEDKVAFDICDFNGNLVKTGVLESNKTEVNLKDAKLGDYYLFILDGPHIHSKRFSIKL